MAEFTNIATPIREVLGGSDITVWTADNLRKCSSHRFSQAQRRPRRASPFGKQDHASSSSPQARPAVGCYQEIATIIDHMGQMSAVAQGLGAVITTTERLQNNPDHFLFIAANSSSALGIIKFGRKKLFHRTSNGSVNEITPMCVLDFYVSERCQRQGVGSALFNFALQHLRVEPYQLGYDRPSIKFLSFLHKHHQLSQYEAQNNNFVVFHDYFVRGEQDVGGGSDSGGGRRGGRRMVGAASSRGAVPTEAKSTKSATTTTTTTTKVEASKYSSWFDQREVEQRSMLEEEEEAFVEQQSLTRQQQQAESQVLSPMSTSGNYAVSSNSHIGKQHGGSRGGGGGGSSYGAAHTPQEQRLQEDSRYQHLQHTGNMLQWPQEGAREMQDGSTRVQLQQQQEEEEQRQQQQQQQQQNKRDPVVSSRNYFASGAARSNRGAFSQLANAPNSYGGGSGGGSPSRSTNLW